MNNNMVKIKGQIFPLIFFITIVSASSCKKSSGTGGNINPVVTGKTFKNPLLNNGPDPFVIKVDSIYYYTNTLGNHLGIWKTTAMSKLSSAPYTTVFFPAPSGPNSANLWAPEFYFINNK